MKKLFLTLFLVLFAFSANAIVIVPPAKSTSTSTSTTSNGLVTIDQNIIGKDFHGCKIIAVRIDREYFNIICYKDGKLYEESYRIKSMSNLSCPSILNCNDWSKDIPILFEEK